MVVSASRYERHHGDESSQQKRLPGAPHETLLVLDATTGQNGLRQAQEFQQAVDVSGVVLPKLHGTAKGGIVVALHEKLGIPIKRIGRREQTQGWLDATLRRYREDGCAEYAVVIESTGDLIGDCGPTYREIDGQRLPELGWDLRSDMWGHGYATEAARGVLTHAAGRLRRVTVTPHVAAQVPAQFRQALAIDLAICRTAVADEVAGGLDDDCVFGTAVFSIAPQRRIEPPLGLLARVRRRLPPEHVRIGEDGRQRIDVVGRELAHDETLGVERQRHRGLVTSCAPIAGDGRLRGLVVAAEDGPREDVGLEGAQVLELLAHADQLDRDPQRLMDGDDDAALGGAVQFGEHDAADVHRLLELLRLAQAVLAGRRVEYEKGLVGGAGQLLLDHPAHLLQLAHEIDLGVQAAGSVDEHHVGAARAGGGDAVEDDGCGVAALVLLHDPAADPPGPHGKLLHRGGPEGVAGHHERGLPHLLEPPGDLADGGRLSGAVHAHHEDHGGLRGHIDPLRLRIVGLQYSGDHVGELVHEGLASLDLLGRAAPLELVDDLDRPVDAHVAGDEELLDLLVEMAVDAHVDRRLELVADGRTRLAEVLAEAPEEPLSLARLFLDHGRRHLGLGDALEHLVPLHLLLLYAGPSAGSADSALPFLARSSRSISSSAILALTTWEPPSGPMVTP